MSLLEENAKVLRQFEDRGVDLSRPRVVDFSHVFPNPTSANSFIESCRTAGFDARDTTNSEMRHSDVTVSIEMIATCQTITSIEQRLDEIAGQHDGRADGWGFLGD